MNNQNLLIYQLPYLFEIMSELDDYLNFNIIEIPNQESLDEQINLISNHLIVLYLYPFELLNKHFRLQVYNLLLTILIE